MLRRKSKYYFSKIAVKLRRNNKKRGCAVFLIIFFIISMLFVLLLAKAEPKIEEMAKLMINTSVTEAVNDAIREKIESGSFCYGELVTLEKDFTGKIIAITTNTAQINALKTEISNEILAVLEEQSKFSLQIPIGNIFGGALMFGRGPCIPVRGLSFTNMSAEFYNDFTHSGINQTRHRIMINFEIDIDMLIPGGAVRDTIDVTMVVAETVIVGDVPEFFTNISPQQ